MNKRPKHFQSGQEKRISIKTPVRSKTPVYRRSESKIKAWSMDCFYEAETNQHLLRDWFILLAWLLGRKY